LNTEIICALIAGGASVLAALEEKSDKPEPVKPFRSYYDKDGDAR